MKLKGSWELIGVTVTLCVIITALAVVVSRDDRDPYAQVQMRTKRIAIVNDMRFALAAASEEQNCAVMSVNEQASKTFIERAAAELDSFKRSRLELDKVIPNRIDENEVKLLTQVDAAFEEYQSISEQLSTLALNSSNRKAYALAFGPANELVQAFDRECERIVAMQEGSQSNESGETRRILQNLRLSTMRIQVRLMPHIAEPNDQKMDEFERLIAAEDRGIEEGLAELRRLVNPPDEIAMIQSLYEQFKGVEEKIIRLSRENSNIRSVDLALNEKRRSMFACEEALASLERTIRAEPIETMIPKGRGQ